MTCSAIGSGTTRKVAEAVNAFRAYPQEIEADIQAHYPGRHIREWHQGTMSSRELLNLIAGLPFESWFKAIVREDMDELIGDATVNEQQQVRTKTLALLRGEAKLTGPVTVTTDMRDNEDQSPRVRGRFKRADQARPPS